MFVVLFIYLIQRNNRLMLSWLWKSYKFSPFFSCMKSFVVVKCVGPNSVAKSSYAFLFHLLEIHTCVRIIFINLSEKLMHLMCVDVL